MLTSTSPPRSGHEAGSPAALLLAAIWRRLTEPPAAIQQPESRRRARLLSSFLVVIIALATVSVLVSLIGIPEALGVQSLLPGLAVVVCAYALNRAGHYAAAIALTVGAVYLSVGYEAVATRRIGALEYLLLAILVSGLLMSPRVATYIYLASLAIILLFSTIMPPNAAPESLEAFFVVGTVGILSLVVTFLRRQDLARIERQARELAIGEARLANILSTASETIITVDERKRIGFFNHAAEQTFGYPAAEVMGQPLELLLPARLREAHQRHTDSFAAAPEQSRPISHRGEIIGRRKDGSEFPMEGGISKLSSEGHTLFTFIGSDITVRRQAEEALMESSTRFRTLFEASPDAIMLIDPHDQWLILDCNTAACQMNGYTLDELVGQSIDMLNLTPGVASERAEYVESIQQNRVLHLETLHRRKDGSVFPVEVSTSLIAVGGREILLGIDRDISERKQAEETLRQRLVELEALHTASLALRTAQSGDEALPILLEEALSATGNDSGAILLYHLDESELQVATARNWFQPFDMIHVKPGEGIAGTVIANGQAYVTADFAGDPQARQLEGGLIPAGWGGACVPIRSGATTAGLLYVAVRTPGKIATDQVKLLESLAEIGGAAMHRMSLYEETRRQLARLEALHTIDLAISSNANLPMTLSILLKHVKTLLNVDAADVLLLHPQMRTLDYAAGLGFRTLAAQATRWRLSDGFAGRAVLERRSVQSDNPAQIQQNLQFAGLGAGEQFSTYYGVPLLAKGEVKGVLEVYRRKAFHPEPEWADFLETLAGQAAIAIDGAQLFEHLQGSNMELALAYDATIEGWSHALDLRDKETEGHTQRVMEITLRLSRSMGLSESDLVHVRRGALLHDIGKMGVPDSILLKPGPLSAEEWVIMRKHAIYAYDMLSPISFLRPALDIPYCHHEKWDGTGYPRGLKGEQIPLVARIFAVVDVWDALRSDRPYRTAWPEEKVREYIQSQSGSHFDPKVVAEFLNQLPT